jgi:glycine oxidase
VKGVDALVIGAGVVGLSAAAELAGRGATVAVVDRSAPGGAGSRAAAGVAIPSLRLLSDPELYDFVQVGARRLNESVTGEDVCRGSGVVRPAWAKEERAELDELASQHPDALGEWLSGDELADLEPLLVDSGALGGYLVPAGYTVDAGRYLDVLLGRCRSLGIDVTLGAEVAVSGENGDALIVRSDTREWHALQVVVAAGAWSGSLPGLPPLPVYPLRGQMIRLAGVSTTRIISGRTYLCPSGDDGVAVGATEERAGFTDTVTVAGLAFLLGRVATRFPRLRSAAVSRTWSGLRSASPDGRPLIGRYPGTTRVLVGAGHSGQGILTGAYTGYLLAELADGRDIDLPSVLRSERLLASAP